MKIMIILKIKSKIQKNKYKYCDKKQSNIIYFFLSYWINFNIIIIFSDHHATTFFQRLSKFISDSLTGGVVSERAGSWI